MSTTVESLISCMEWAARNKLDEYAFVQDGHRVTLRRGSPVSQGAAAPVEPVAQAFAGVSVAAQEAAEPADLAAVTAPLAGICHLAQDPASPPFVEVGAMVTKGQTVCVIEAMKVMSAIVADQDGTVAEICVEDGASVEAGANLVMVRA